MNLSQNCFHVLSDALIKILHCWQKVIGKQYTSSLTFKIRQMPVQHCALLKTLWQYTAGSPSAVSSTLLIPSEQNTEASVSVTQAVWSHSVWHLSAWTHQQPCSYTLIYIVLLFSVYLRHQMFVCLFVCMGIFWGDTDWQQLHSVLNTSLNPN